MKRPLATALAIGILAGMREQLAEAGDRSLDAPATDYLPADFTFDTNGATIRHLLSHRSGGFRA